jgi:hypothetical protein
MKVEARAWLSPKSVILTRQRSSTRMLGVLRSRCRMGGSLRGGAGAGGGGRWRGRRRQRCIGAWLRLPAVLTAARPSSVRRGLALAPGAAGPAAGRSPAQQQPPYAAGGPRPCAAAHRECRYAMPRATLMAMTLTSRGSSGAPRCCRSTWNRLPRDMYSDTMHSSGVVTCVGKGRQGEVRAGGRGRPPAGTARRGSAGAPQRGARRRHPSIHPPALWHSRRSQSP